MGNLGNTKLSKEQREKIYQLHYENGYPFSVLAEDFNVSVITIRRICRPDYYEKQLKSNENYRKKTKEKKKEIQKNNYVRYNLSFHKLNDSQVISKLAEQDNINGYIKSLIKKDINKENDE